MTTAIMFLMDLPFFFLYSLLFDLFLCHCFTYLIKKKIQLLIYQFTFVKFFFYYNGWLKADDNQLARF